MATTKNGLTPLHMARLLNRIITIYKRLPVWTGMMYYESCRMAFKDSQS